MYIRYYILKAQYRHCYINLFATREEFVIRSPEYSVLISRQHDEQGSGHIDEQ